MRVDAPVSLSSSAATDMHLLLDTSTEAGGVGVDNDGMDDLGGLADDAHEPAGGGRMAGARGGGRRAAAVPEVLDAEVFEAGEATDAEEDVCPDTAIPAAVSAVRVENFEEAARRAAAARDDPGGSAGGDGSADGGSGGAASSGPSGSAAGAAGAAGKSRKKQQAQQAQQAQLLRQAQRQAQQEHQRVVKTTLTVSTTGIAEDSTRVVTSRSCTNVFLANVLPRCNTLRAGGFTPWPCVAGSLDMGPGVHGRDLGG